MNWVRFSLWASGLLATVNGERRFARAGSLNVSSNWNTSYTSSTATDPSTNTVSYPSTHNAITSNALLDIASISASQEATVRSQNTSAQIIADQVGTGIPPNKTTSAASLPRSVPSIKTESLADVFRNSSIPTASLDPSHRPLAWNVTSLITANQTASPSKTSSSSSYVRYWWLESCNSTSYANDYPITYRTPPDFCREFDWVHGVHDFAYYEDRCLVDWCDKSFSSKVEAFTGPYTDFITLTDVSLPVELTTGSDGELTPSYASTLSTSIYSQTYDQMWLALLGTYDAPCCGDCYLTASSIHLYYWPDQVTASLSQTPSGPSSTLVNANGFTFISPSIYIAFTSLLAHDKCGTMSEDIITETTLAFDLSEINTIPGWEEYFPELPRYSTTYCSALTEYWYGFEAGVEDDFTGTTLKSELPRPLTLADIAQNCSTLPGYIWNSLDPGNSNALGDPCHPYIDFLATIKSLRPKWARCTTEVLEGLYDPPVTLRQGAFLVPTALATLTTNVPSVAPTPGQEIPVIPQPTSRSSSSIQSDPHSPGSGGSQASSVPERPSNPAQHIDASRLAPPLTLLPFPLFTPINENPITLTLAPEKPERPELSFEIITLFPTRTAGIPVVVVGTQTLVPGRAITVGGRTTAVDGQTSVIGGTRLSLRPRATAIVLGGQSTIDIVSRQPTKTALPLQLTFNGVTITANAATQFILDGQTLVPGGVINVDATELFLDPQGTAVIIGRTSTVNLLAPSLQSTLAPLAFAFHGEIITADTASSARFVVKGQTLVRGGVVTVDGTQLFLDPQGTAIMIGEARTATITLRPGPMTVGGSTIKTSSNDEHTITGGMALSLTVEDDAYSTKGAAASVPAAATTTRVQAEGTRYRPTLVEILLACLAWYLGGEFF